MMTYLELCTQLREGNVVLTRTESGLDAKPGTAITPQLAAAIKRHKTALLAAPILSQPDWIVLWYPKQ